MKSQTKFASCVNRCSIMKTSGSIYISKFLSLLISYLFVVNDVYHGCWCAWKEGEGERERKDYLEINVRREYFKGEEWGDIQDLFFGRSKSVTFLFRKNEPKSILLPLCSLIIKEGIDTTVFEWKRGKKPTAVERPPFDTLLYEDNEV